MYAETALNFVDIVVMYKLLSLILVLLLMYFHIYIYIVFIQELQGY